MLNREKDDIFFRRILPDLKIAVEGLSAFRIFRPSSDGNGSEDLFFEKSPQGQKGQSCSGYPFREKVPEQPPPQSRSPTAADQSSDTSDTSDGFEPRGRLTKNSLDPADEDHTAVIRFFHDRQAEDLASFQERRLSTLALSHGISEAADALPTAEGICPLDASEPWLGLRRILRASPPVIEIFLPDDAPNIQRTLDTACRLAALLSVWSRGGLLLHAAALVRNFQDIPADSRRQEAIVALALSGGGKSTLTDHAEGFDSLSDETAALVPGKNGEWQVLGTLFRSSSRKAPHPMTAARLSSILILEKSPFSRLLPASESMTVRKILEQSYAARPLAGNAPETLRRAAAIAKNFPAYRFLFTKSSPEVQALLNDVLASASGALSPNLRFK